MGDRRKYNLGLQEKYLLPSSTCTEGLRVLTAPGGVFTLRRMPGYQQDPRHTSRTYATSRPDLETGVRTFMSGVYAWMAFGFAITAAAGYFVASTPHVFALVHSGYLAWVFLLAPLALSMFIFPRIPNMDTPIAIGMFVVFAASIGVWFSYIPLAYSSASIFTILAGTIAMFVGTSLAGWFTKRDLSGIAQFFVMALLGAVFASLVNIIFIGSGGMSLFISAIVAVVAAGLTAYHTQAVKQMYLVNGNRSNLAILGALLLYVDFINLFVSLLRLFGSRD